MKQTIAILGALLALSLPAGAQVVSGSAPDGASPRGNSVPVAGVGSDGKVHTIYMDSQGRVWVNINGTPTVTVSGSVAVTGSFYQATQPVSIASPVAVTGTFWPYALGQQLAANSVPIVLTATQLSSLTPLSTIAVSNFPSSQAVTGTFWPATQPVSGTFWQSTQPVSIATMPSTPVTGTFWQSTQPVSIASMPSTPVTGTFWQTTQPVSVASMPSTPVTGTFWQSTQPVSIASMPTTPTQPTPATSGGDSDAFVNSASGTNATNVKASAGQLYSVYFANNGAGWAYVKLYNSSSSPTAGSGTPFRVFGIPPGQSVAWASAGGMGIPMSSGIGYTITGAAGNSDTTSVAANQVIGDVEYK